MSEYPRMIYHSNGQTKTVADPEMEAEAGEGWSREPSEVHFGARSPEVPESPAIVAPVDPSGQDALIDKIIARMRDEFGFGESETGDETEPTTDRPRRGRPRNADRAASRTSDTE
jgi:hypothetical protein